MLSSSANFKSRGFSLIEMMIVTGIIAILAALGAPSYTAWIQNTRIRTAAESMQNGLQMARVEAVKRNTPVQFALGANSAWTVSCVTAARCADLAGGVVQTRKAKDGSSTEIVIATTPAASNTVVFNGIGTVGAAPVPFTQVNISSSVSAADRPLRITLGLGGNVRMCDPYAGLPASDPRKC